MAKLTNPLHALSATGTIGNMITYRHTPAGAVAHRHPTIHIPRTAAQIEHQNIYQLGCASWQNLQDEERARWRARAKPLHVTGFNKFMHEWLIAASGQPTPGSDPYWGNVTIAMHFDGENGSADFIDEKGATVNSAGATITTSNKKFGSGALTIPDSTADAGPHITATGANALTNIFTIEFWLYVLTGDHQTCDLINQNHYNSAITISNGNIDCTLQGGPDASVSAEFITAETWHHVAYASDDEGTGLYIDGINQNGGAGGAAFGDGLSDWHILENLDASGSAGYLMDDLRITKGIRRYTVDFIRPDASFPNG